MKKGQILEGIVEAVDFPNKGRLVVEGRTVIVKNTLPGQKIEFMVSKLRKGKAQGRLLRVLESSPIEIEPACRHFQQCGGCIFQNLKYEDQLQLKAAQVKELIDTAAVQGYQFEGAKESPCRYGYRNKMEFSFGDEVKDGPLALGMHKQGGFYDIVTVTGCQIADGDFRAVLACVLAFFADGKNHFYHKMRHEGCLRHLVVRKGFYTGEILVNLVTTTQESVDMEGLAQELLQLQLEGTIVGILHTLNDSLADVVQSDEMRIVYGQDYFYEELLGLRFKITPFSFFQTNTAGAEVLYETARNYIGQLATNEDRPKVVFDLYSGTGTIAQLMAGVADRVIGVELVEEAVAAAKVNAGLNGLHNCEFLAGDVLKMLDVIEEKPDFIILDPPRDGVHPKALRKIIDYGVERLLYISCKPTSLARDLVVLQEHGYRLEKACCVDMFPWTGNVETVCLLSKLHADQHIEVKLQMDELDLMAAEKFTT